MEEKLPKYLVRSKCTEYETLIANGLGAKALKRLVLSKDSDHVAFVI